MSLDGGAGQSKSAGPYSLAALKTYIKKQEMQETKERQFVLKDGKIVYMDNYSNE